MHYSVDVWNTGLKNGIHKYMGFLLKKKKVINPGLQCYSCDNLGKKSVCEFPACSVCATGGAKMPDCWKTNREKCHKDNIDALESCVSYVPGGWDK